MTENCQLPSAPLPGSIHPSPSCESGSPSFSLPGHLSGQSEVFSGSTSKACTCNCNCEQFSFRLQQLEQKVDALMTVQPQTPNSIPRKPPLSVQKREHVNKGRRGNNFFGKFFFPFQLQFGGERRETFTVSSFFPFSPLFLWGLSNCLLFFLLQKRFFRTLQSFVWGHEQQKRMWKMHSSHPAMVFAFASTWLLACLPMPSPMT